MLFLDNSRQLIYTLRWFSFLILLLSFLFLSKSAFAAEYYVNNSGNDSNPGTQAQPWQTVDKVSNSALAAGDKVYFAGGQTFSGNLYLDEAYNGTSSNPIVISSYGTGRATIDAGDSYGIFAYNNGGYTISNLIIQGAGTSTNTESGINFYNEKAGNVVMDHIYFDNVEVSGFGDYGIIVGAFNGTSGYNDIRITNSTVHDNSKAGIVTYGPDSINYVNTDVYIGYNTLYENKGLTGLTTHTGDGVALGSVDGATVEYNVSHDNGELNQASEGPVAFMAYDSKNITFQYNEAYNMKTQGLNDGAGFDLDQNVSNSIIQYNYSHNNEGSGFQLVQSPNTNLHTNNIIRYNISENDNRNNNTVGAITVYGKVNNAEIYNNTVYITKPTSISPRAAYIFNDGATSLDPTNVHFRNNIFYVASNSLSQVEVTPDVLIGGSGILFQGNNYYRPDGGVSIVWGSSTYTSLSSWRSGASQEQVSGTNTGLNTNPGLTDPGNGGTIGNAANLSALSAYKLLSTSSLINQGLNLNSSFSLSIGSNDFYGNSLSGITSFDIGAHEYVAAAQSSSNSSSDSSSPSSPACTSSAPYGVPDLFQIDAKASNAKLIFTTTKNTSGYLIAYGLDGVNYLYGTEIQYSGPLWIWNLDINQLTPNTTYYFKVKSINGCNGGQWSEPLKIKTTKSKNITTNFFAN